MYQLGQDITPEQAMRFAVETAKLGRGLVSPNPLVGCVIVDKDHKFLGSGAHLRHGGPHAEINAIKSIKETDLLKGGTLYVTLEPCSHHGKTPPCCEAIAEAGIVKVVYGVEDPNPQVAGNGLKFLKEKGIQTEVFSKYQNDCLEVAEHFFFHMKNRTPFISLKVGTSLDGKIALMSGESQWITSEEARIHGRQIRGHYDATMIGAGTMQYDNPTLDFRDTGFQEKKQNKVVILDPKGKASEDFKESKLYKTHGSKNIYVLTRRDHVAKWSKNLVHVVEWEANPEGWRQSLKNLYQKGIYSIYVEGGSYVFGQILSFRLAQKIYLYQSSKILGNGVSWSKYFENNKLAEAPQLKKWNSFPVGEDRLNIAYF